MEIDAQNMENSLYISDKIMEYDMEKSSIDRLSDMKGKLETVISAIIHYNECVCNCEHTMRIIHFHSKSSVDLWNKLPQLKRDLELVIMQLDETTQVIMQTLEQPNNMQLISMKERHIMKLDEVLYIMEYKYIMFNPRFPRLNNYLESKLNICTNLDLLEAKEHLDEKNDTLKIDNQDEVISGKYEIFGYINLIPEFQDMHSNSSKDDIDKSGFGFDNPDKTIDNKLAMDKLLGYIKTIEDFLETLEFIRLQFDVYSLT